MKKIILALFVISGLFIGSVTHAQDYKTALGVRLSSSPAMIGNSISLKHFFKENMAVEGYFAFGDPLALGAMLEIHKPLAPAGLTWYYGAGAYLGFLKTYNAVKQKDETDVNLGGQGVIGLDYKFTNIPLNLSLDWKPELNIVSDINFEPAAVGITARFTFGK